MGLSPRRPIPVAVRRGGIGLPEASVTLNLSVVVSLRITPSPVPFNTMTGGSALTGTTFSAVLESGAMETVAVAWLGVSTRVPVMMSSPSHPLAV